MKKALLFSFCLLTVALQVFGQDGPQMKQFKFPLAGTSFPQTITKDYFPLLNRLEAPYPGGDSEKGRINAIKKDLEASYQIPNAASKVDSTAASPWFGQNFQTNQTINGVPNDNDMAISNDGKVVSVINSNIYMHDEDGTLLQNISLDAWSTSLGITGSKFDPRALYDPIHDRFIIACLNGFTDSTSFIILGFSQSNDPTAGWNMYALPGDPNNDSLWTDYPIMALTADELFLTGNLLYNDQPWQTGFSHSICWQLDLDSAYAGNALSSNLWFNVNFGGAPIRNLCPIQGGSGPAGPNMYLVSNRNFATSNDTVFIMEITDTINAPGVQYLVDYGISNTPYSLSPNAVQQFNQLLATNDARWLDGFIENGNIQFVGNCRDANTGRSAFYHGVINDITGSRTVTGNIIGNSNGAYGYPAIGWMGMTAGSDEALIAINYCGTTAATRPGCGGIYFDGINDYSPLVICKTGVGYINAISGIDRWGDYTGVQTRYNNPGEVWIGATFGKSNQQPGTWLAAFHHPSIVAEEGRDAIQEFDATSYPNPTQDILYVDFELDVDRFLDISLVDQQGAIVKTLVRDRVRSGTNRIHFSTKPLAAGIYFLRISENGSVLKTEKIIKTN